jgi:hypothetical protein
VCVGAYAPHAHRFCHISTFRLSSYFELFLLDDVFAEWGTILFYHLKGLVMIPVLRHSPLEPCKYRYVD